ncbi:H-NS histone family protein [Salmonella enterica]|nr:H-NS histone family protein [Salmonella enterica]EFP6579692.1 H-NS histone family protein [Salmonella enterica]EGC7970974.1 H-NS histone family protein [Salmonella enterica]EIV4461157.1 H-NS histone family protein [Salmonella enterica]
MILLLELLNMTTLKKVAKSQNGNDLLISLKDKLSVIVEERREVESSLIKKVADKERKIKLYREMLLRDGISPYELMPKKPLLSASDINQNIKKSYSYYSNGKQKVWSGRGRMPKEIKSALKVGGRLIDFINKDGVNDG